MISFILSSFFAFWVALLPVYLWGYSANALQGNDWSRMRFWVGIFIGAISVVLVYLLTKYASTNTDMMILFVASFFLILYLVVFFLTFLGSSFARIFLRKIAIVHIVIIFSLSVVIILLSKILPGGYLLSTVMITLLLASVFEEGSKHLMSIGMTGKDFRFSRKDIIFFTFSVVLGFIFIENILYFFSGILPVGQWIFRSIFTMIIHIFAATICAHFWWKALSYKLFSFRYFIVFFSGFVLAAMVHMLYNLSLQTGNIMVVIVFAIIGYMMFTRLIVKE